MNIKPLHFINLTIFGVKVPNVIQKNSITWGIFSNQTTFWRETVTLSVKEFQQSYSAIGKSISCSSSQVKVTLFLAHLSLNCKNLYYAPILILEITLGNRHFVLIFSMSHSKSCLIGNKPRNLYYWSWVLSTSAPFFASNLFTLSQKTWKAEDIVIANVRKKTRYDDSFFFNNDPGSIASNTCGTEKA